MLPADALKGRWRLDPPCCLMHRPALLPSKFNPCRVLPVPQVLKGQLALIAPSISCGDFIYEEGEGLEEDEVPPPPLLADGVLCFAACVVQRSASSWLRYSPMHLTV